MQTFAAALRTSMRFFAFMGLLTAPLAATAAPEQSPTHLKHAGAGHAGITHQADIDPYLEYLKKNGILGPQSIELRNQASLTIPDGFAYIPEVPAKAFMQRMGNTTDANFIGIMLPTKTSNWFTMVEYIPAGYIKDDDAKTWNADDLLKSVRTNTETANEDRRKRGIGELEVVGWAEKPRYDAATHRLVWSIEARTKGSQQANSIVNYKTLMLGREGYIAMTLVTDMNTIEAQKPIANLLLSGLNFAPGKRYSDFDASTDHVAEYGLAALIGGVVVHKLGFFALIAAFAVKFAKAALLLFIGLGAAIRKWAGQIKSKITNALGLKSAEIPSNAAPPE